MTPGFWISSITVAGHPTRRDSSVGFESGLNVIYGPSNSGKSWVLQCIDYVFGLKADEFVLDENSGYTEVRMGVRTAQGSLTLSRPIGEGANNIEVSSTDPRIESGTYKRQSSGRSPLLSSVWLKLIGYDAPENLKIIKNQNLETQALTWRTFWHALYADEDRISTKKPILLPLQTTAQPAFKCALASLITGKDYAAYARDESVETRKLRNNAIIDYLEPLPKQLEERIELIDKALGSSDPAEIQQRIDELIAELERVQQRITHATVQGQDVIARLQQVRDSLAESRSLRNRYEELAASYRARIERFDFVEEGHALTAHREPATTCPVCTQALPPEARSAVPEPDLRERHDLAARLNDLRQTIHQMDLEQAPLQEQEQDLAAEAERIARRISGELEPQLQALSTSLASHNAIIAMQAEREQHLERKQAIEDENKPSKTNLKNARIAHSPRATSIRSTNTRKRSGRRWAPTCSTSLEPARSPDSKMPDSRVNCSMLSSTAKPKRRKGRATGRSSTPLSCSPSGNTSPPRTPHTTPACSSSTPHYWGSTIHSSTPSFKKPVKPSPLPSTTTSPSNKTAVR